MTLEEAVDVLNERRHRDCAGWWIRGYAGGAAYACGTDPHDWLEPLEAIVIAEAYRSGRWDEIRDGAGAMTMAGDS